MNKRTLWALILIALTAVVLILNRGSMELQLGFSEIRALTAIVLLGFTVVGVAIGFLLR